MRCVAATHRTLPSCTPHLPLACVTAAGGLHRSAAAAAAAAAAGQPLPEPQWVCCDVRKFDLAVLGKFGVIMADPPWAINVGLPYGIMDDDEMRGMDLSGQLVLNGV